MTRATAASVNISKSQGTRSMINPRAGASMSKSSIGKKTAATAVGRLVKPHSQADNQSKHFKTAGEVLNYPYSFDDNGMDEETAALDNQMGKQQYEEQYRVAEIQNEQLYSPIREDFAGAKDVAKALFDMTEIEGINEKKRRELILRSDFNLCDCFKMFGGLSHPGKRGIDCDDLYHTITVNLELTITKDEVFIMFYKLDKDGDGLISYEEMSDCFKPRAHEYAQLLESRGGFYGSESDFKKYFEGPTRELLKRFIKGYVDCEVSIELVR